MTSIQKILFSALIIIISNTLKAAPEVNKKSETTSAETNSRIEIIQNQVAEVKRDQLNYQIEKNLLAETYKINYERLNLMITAILGIFAVLGYLGVRDIKSIKEDFKKELDDLRKINTDVNSLSNDLAKKASEYENKFNQIIVQNNSQAQKIKQLELKEKLSALVAKDDYQQAIEYCDIILAENPKDEDVWADKALAHRKMLQYKESLDALTKIEELENGFEFYALDKAETCLFLRDLKGYNDVKEKYPAEFNDEEHQPIAKMLEILSTYLQKDFVTTEKLIRDYVNTNETQPIQLCEDKWDFGDAISFIEDESESNTSILLKNALKYASGSLSGQALALLHPELKKTMKS